MKKRIYFFIALSSIVYYLISHNIRLQDKLAKMKIKFKLKKYINISRRAKDNQELAAAWYMIGNIYHFDLNKPESAKEYYEKIVKDNEENYLEDAAMFNLGLVLKEMNKTRQANQIFRKVIERFPASARARDAELELSRL
ncbi:MAG: hypothetical protein C0601_05800 [Candidatus Muiribacterium halophilum]|uniref:Uncharacterized protein n=1 Tax=Muiribacterium halophilum TaxID=2053465 RepID=A0A2N5ZHC1_MUIH1|nr:MAG: hypothetical protein C0601_05800 [Candidatus Muirbacterium halophilum]